MIICFEALLDVGKWCIRSWKVKHKISKPLFGKKVCIWKTSKINKYCNMVIIYIIILFAGHNVQKNQNDLPIDRPWAGSKLMSIEALLDGSKWWIRSWKYKNKISKTLFDKKVWIWKTSKIDKWCNMIIIYILNSSYLLITLFNVQKIKMTYPLCSCHDVCSCHLNLF